MILVPPIARLLALLAGIHGTVYSAGSGAGPAVGVQIEVDGTVRCVSDTAGRYAVGGLAIGLHQLRFISGSYELREIKVFLVDSTTLALDVDLTPRPAFLPPISVVARRPADSANAWEVSATDWHESGHYRFAPGWQEGQPAGGVDIQDALSRLPGISTRGDNTTSLSVHGGGGSENLTLLDGIPLYGAVHFAGASSAVNPDAISAMDVHAGVSSARFGGALAGVVELETGDGLGDAQVSGDLSTADFRSTIRTPLGANSGMLLSGRSSFRDLLTDETAAGTTNGYQDFLAAGHTVIGSGVLRLVGFTSANRLRWNPVVIAPDRGTPSASTTGTTHPSDTANWRSTAIGATWTEPLGHEGEWRTAAWWSGSGATVTTLLGNETARLNSSIGELGLSSGWSGRYRASTLSVGGELTRPGTTYHSGITVSTSGTSLSDVALSATPVIGAVYGEWDWHGGALLDFRAGLRASTDFRLASTLDPRLLLNLHAGAATRIEIGYGRTHQLAQSMLNEDNVMSSVIGPALLTNGGNGLAAAADQWIVSIAHRLGPDVMITLDGYDRTWSNVVAPAVTTAAFFVSSAAAYGDGRARGMNASVSIVRGRLSVDATAGLASSVQRADGMSYPSGYNRPWAFSGDIDYRLPARTTLQLRWNTGAGESTTEVLSGVLWRPYQPATGSGEIEGTATNASGAINALQLPGTFRFDIGARREWHLGVLGRSSGLTTAVRFENLFNRADPIGIMARSDGTLQLLRGTPRGLVFEVGWAR